MQIFMLNMYNLLRFIQNPVASVFSNTINNGNNVNQAQMGGGGASGNTDTTKLEEAMENGTISNFHDVAKVIDFITKKILGPVLSVIGIVFVIMAIRIGFEYAKAQDASEREKCKGKLIGMIVGGVIMVVGAVLAFSINWAAIYYDLSGMSHDFIDGTLDNDELCDPCGLGQENDIHA